MYGWSGTKLVDRAAGRRRLAQLIAYAGLVLVAGSTTAASAGAERQSFGLVTGPVRLIAAGAPVRVEGLHGYFGTLVLEPRADGILLVNRLPLERYLLGLNEVPTAWPAEALKAQVVAARTYAARTLALPHAGAAATYGFDICASIDCQVFSGADVVLGSGGDSWRAAVEATAGEVLVHDGGPILARYHSTSGGVTLNNEDVFVGEPAYPYLVGVPSPYETASPLFRWRVDFPLGRLQDLLTRAGLWTSVQGRLVDVATVASAAGKHYPDVEIRGRRGTITLTAEELRDALRDLAPEMYPRHYPSPADTASGRLPETFPSNRFEIATKKRVAYVLGRGWGHGVGMSQWGAFGLAERGADYAGILRHYYRGVELVESYENPTVDVGVAWQLADVVVEGEFDVVDSAGRFLAEDALGRWRFAASPGGLRVYPPRGHELPLTIEVVRAPRELPPLATGVVSFALSKPARVGVAPRLPAEKRPEVYSAGRQTVAWRAPRRPGTYRIRLVARSGDEVERTEPVRIVVRAPGAATRSTERDERGRGWVIGAVIAGAVAAAASAVTIGRWARRPR